MRTQALIPLVLFGLLASPLTAQEDLLKNFPKIQHQGEPHLAVSIKPVLALALTRARSVKVLHSQAKHAKETFEAERGPERITWTNSLTNQKSFMAFGSADPSSLASLTATESQLFQTSVTAKSKFGISYGLTYQQGNSSSAMGSVPADGSATGWTDPSDPLYQSNLIAEVKIPLLQGMGKVGYLKEAQAEAFYRQSQIRLEEAMRNLAQTISNIYWDLVEVQENLKTLKAALELARDFHQEARLREELGQLALSEVTQARVQLSLAEQNLLQEEMRREGIEDQMRAALDLPDLNERYLAVEKTQLREAPNELAPLLEKSFKMDPAANQLRAQQALAQIGLQRALDQDESKLDLNLSYSKNGFGDAANPDTSDSDLAGYRASLVFSMPLYDNRTDRAVSKAMADVENVEIQLADRRSFLQVRLQGLLRNLEALKKSIELARTSVELNGELLERETENFKMGNSTSYRLSMAQQDLAKARLQETKARIQYEKTYTALLVTSGEIYRHHGLAAEVEGATDLMRLLP